MAGRINRVQAVKSAMKARSVLVKPCCSCCFLWYLTLRSRTSFNLGKLTLVSCQNGTALISMLKALGGAAFNNEFGRPNLLGYSVLTKREQTHAGSRANFTPIMLAGGLGNIRCDDHVQKKEIPVGASLIVLAVLQ